MIVMKTYNVILSALLSMLCLGACQKNERMLFEAKSAVYFSSTLEGDSLSYSFASGEKNEDVVNIPVRIIGASTQETRAIAFEIDPSSTAQEGVHYRDMPETITLLPDSVNAYLPITVLAENLDNESVFLVFRLLSNETFDLGFPEHISFKLNITDQLVKPTYWDIPLSLYYGSYSKAKHQLCIQIQGFDFPPEMDMNMINDYMSYGRLVYQALLKEPVWDEETQQWITADWSPL